MDAGKVADKIMYALNNKKQVTIIDWRYRVLVFFWKMILAGFGSDFLLKVKTPIYLIKSSRLSFHYKTRLFFNFFRFIL